MPTYAYRCTKCGTEIEVVQSMSDPPLKRCKECRGKLQRTFHPVGIVLKGSGFHKTDYRTKKPADRKSDEKSSEKSSSDDKSSSDKKAETKPADTKKSSETKSSPTE